MVDEIIASLSRIKWLVVAARTSTFAFKGQKADIREIARKLQVRYVLEGSVQKAGQHVRIIGQLIDANSGGNIWADRIDGKIEDIFDVQDRITERVVGAIEPKLLHAEIERAKRKRPESMDAYDCYLRALSNSHRPTPDDSAEALLLLKKGSHSIQILRRRTRWQRGCIFNVSPQPGQHRHGRTRTVWQTGPHRHRIRRGRSSCLVPGGVPAGSGRRRRRNRPRRSQSCARPESRTQHTSCITQLGP